MNGNHSVITSTVVHFTVSLFRTQNKGFSIQFTKDGDGVGQHHCDFKSYMAVHTLVDGFRQLLKSGGNAALAAPLLHSVGVEMFYLWLQPFWSAIENAMVAERQLCLTVVADSAEILNLPWELLRWPDDVVLGLDSRTVLRRRVCPGSGSALVEQDRQKPSPSVPPPPGFPPVADSPLAVLRVPPSPLTMLLVSSQPEGLHRADTANDLKRVLTRFEKCEKPLENISLHHAATATRGALQQAVQRSKPEIVWLHGPALIRGEQGFFGFEDEEGGVDIRSAKEIFQELFTLYDLSLVIVTGREKQAPPPVAAIGALCQGFVALGTAAALAWPSGADDPFFSDFLYTFLHNVSRGETLDQAVRQARQTIQPACDRLGYPAWVLPALYA